MFNDWGGLNAVNAGSLISALNNPVFVEWLSTLGISVGTALIVAGILSIFSGRLLGLPPQHKLWSFIVGFAFLCSLSAVVPAEPHTSSAGLFTCLPPNLEDLIYFLPPAAAFSVLNPHFQSGLLIYPLFALTALRLRPP